MAAATAYCAAPPPKSPKATNPDTTGPPVGAGAVVDTDDLTDAGLDVATAEGFVLAFVPPPPHAAIADTATPIATVTDRRRIYTTLPENGPKELSRRPRRQPTPDRGSRDSG
jgi:hypothetical protein